MSEITNHKEERVEALTSYMRAVIEGVADGDTIKSNRILEHEFIASDVIELFDILFDSGYSVEQLKMPSNRLFNLLHKKLENSSVVNPKEGSLLYWIVEDNRRIEKLLEKTKIDIAALNSSGVSGDLLTRLKSLFKDIGRVDKHYIIKENILFPLMESEWREHACLKLMWSFHDDIRKNIKSLSSIIESNEFDLKEFNRLVGLIYFNINTIIFREERVLISQIDQTIDSSKIDSLLRESKEIGFGFIDGDEIEVVDEEREGSISDSFANLSTGSLSIEQLELLFKALPVDMTFVDENDEVRFYSDPPHRVFPRTTAIIGRKVQYCHPPESVDIVEKILDAFKSGTKDSADFWIKMGSKFVYIRYFAMRDSGGKYRGTLEVSQEVSEIRALEGEHRLLDWG